MNNPVDGRLLLWYVHSMNDKGHQVDDYRSLLVLDEISKNQELTQRDLSRNLGVALGLVNSYLKNLVSKGFVTVASIPKNRYKYFLTPHGLAEKTRLTYQHLHNFTNLYRVARTDFHDLFAQFRLSKKKRVVFCGVDEVTEIAYLSLKESELELAGIIDAKTGRKKFLGHDILPIYEVRIIDYDVIVITSFGGGEGLRQALIDSGVDAGKIADISASGWLKKLEG